MIYEVLFIFFISVPENQENKVLKCRTPFDSLSNVNFWVSLLDNKKVSENTTVVRDEKNNRVNPEY